MKDIQELKKTVSDNQEASLVNSWICSYCIPLLDIRTTRRYDYDFLSADANKSGNRIMSHGHDLAMIL
jgi:hypothetical protein